MIITRIWGGLGNQMFEYAFGRNLATAKNTELKLDVSYYAQKNKRAYGLKYFNIREGIAAPEEIANLQGGGRIIGLVERLKPYYKRRIIKQKHLYFDSSIFRAGINAYLDGYWQSEKYFAGIADIIRREFVLKSEHVNSINKDILRRIENTNSVSLHVRRGDYLKLKNTFCVCPMDYYRQAVEKISQVVNDPVFFVFSDDMAWAKENLKINFPVEYVSDNYDLEDYEELILMSRCKHNVIANSSFSWWGAWLNNNPDKIVIAPAKWYSSDKYRNPDNIPGEWIKI